LIDYGVNGELQARWRNDQERRDVIAELLDMLRKKSEEYAAVLSQLNYLESVQANARQATGPVLWWGGGNVGNAIRMLQVGTRVATGVAHASQSNPIHRQKHLLEVCLINIRSILQQAGHDA
jgi:hypothetical protein